MFMVFHILGMIIPTDLYFSEGFKPPTRRRFGILPTRCKKSTQRGAKGRDQLLNRIHPMAKFVGFL
jgi:hypothetical protein